MKNAIEWFKEKGFTFNDKITIADVIALQNDARKDALMEAQGVASDVIRGEATKYSVISDAKFSPSAPPKEMALDGLSYKVASRITAMADKLDCLPKVNTSTSTSDSSKPAPDLEKIPNPDEGWALVELYRWQYGELPPQSGECKPLSKAEALRSFVRLLNAGDMSKLPLPFNVSIVLAHIATELETMEHELEHVWKPCAKMNEAYARSFELELKQLKARAN